MFIADSKDVIALSIVVSNYVLDNADERDTRLMFALLDVPDRLANDLIVETTRIKESTDRKEAKK